MDSRTSSALLLTVLLASAVQVLAGSPPSNTIPIVSMKTGQGTSSFDITLEVICDLLWHNFDGIWVEGWLTLHQEEPADLCDSTGAYMVIAPSNLQELNNNVDLRWGRYSPSGIQSSSAFIHPNSTFQSIDSSVTAVNMLSNIVTRCSSLYSQSQQYDCIWYYDIFNEGPAWQLWRMKGDTKPYDDYFPSMYTQDTMMVDIATTGVFSWASWKSDSIYEANSVYCPSVSVCFSSIHHIDSLRIDSLGNDSTGWAGCVPGVQLGTTHQQANSVRAYFNMEYLLYSASPPYALEDNFPERMDLNTYPVRMAGYAWQDSRDSITVLGSATDLWMLEHYEEILDSTFIPAGTDPDGPFPINYHVQGFGRTGGKSIWQIIKNEPPEPPDTVVNYEAYSYRIPSPAEFRMLCNIGLLRGAKGVFPYSIRSYSGDFDSLGTPHHHDTGLLDEDLIPFDTPYEDWVYRERPTSDYYYAPPDSIPPWTAADGSQFDPLYSLPSQPTPPTAAKATETYLEWKFAAYARLWNSVRGTFRQIAWVAPELSRLWWWFSDDRYDNAQISYDSGSAPIYFATPHIRVFTDSTESTCYLFYVNRFCRANNNPFEITVDSDSFPRTTDFSEYALDHSRRVLIEGSESSGFYTFLDTLDAGEARLLEMFDSDEGLDADLRITDPDIFVVIPADGDTLTDTGSTAGTPFDIYTWVYNMGTDPLNNVKVYLEDVTADTLCDSVYLSFSGLSTSSCFQTDRALASFNTITPDTSAIGVNLFRVYTDRIPNEPDPDDNSATMVYMVRPRDYATEVLDDSWDMDPPVPPISPPSWYTFDIHSLTGCWGSYTDSISGMFEGTLSNPANANALYLNTGSGRDEWVDADRFVNFSLAGCSENSLDIEVHWITSDSSYFSTDIQEDLQATAADIGPVDLSSLNGNWNGDVIALWLEFSGSNLATDVRIGWVKLTE